MATQANQFPEREMFYEEAVIDGLWCKRSTPNGEWVALSERELSDKLTALSQEWSVMFDALWLIRDETGKAARRLAVKALNDIRK